MNISKLTVSQETLSKVNRVYTPEQKRKARFEGVARLLKEKDNEPITAHELYNAAGFLTNTQKGVWKAAAFVKNAKKNGILKKLDSGRKSRYELDLSKIDPKNRKSKSIISTVEEDLNKSVIKVEQSSQYDENNSYTSSSSVNNDIDSNITNEANDTQVNVNIGRHFSFEITINEKRDHGYKKLGAMDMTEVSKKTMTELVNNFINRI